MLSLLRKLLRVPVAKVEAKSPSLTHTPEKMLGESVCSVAHTVTSMEDSSSGREYEPPLFLASDGEKPKPKSTSQVSNNRESDSMQTDGPTADWQDDVDWDSVTEPPEDWGVEWND
jgi:hypothetical protein